MQVVVMIHLMFLKTFKCFLEYDCLRRLFAVPCGSDPEEPVLEMMRQFMKRMMAVFLAVLILVILPVLSLGEGKRRDGSNGV